MSTAKLFSVLMTLLSVWLSISSSCGARTVRKEGTGEVGNKVSPTKGCLDCSAVSASQSIYPIYGAPPAPPYPPQVLPGQANCTPTPVVVPCCQQNQPPYPYTPLYGYYPPPYYYSASPTVIINSLSYYCSILMWLLMFHAC